MLSPYILLGVGVKDVLKNTDRNYREKANMYYAKYVVRKYGKCRKILKDLRVINFFVINFISLNG